MFGKIHSAIVIIAAIMLLAACTGQPLLVGTTMPTAQTDQATIDELTARITALEEQLAAAETTGTESPSSESPESESHESEGQRFDVIIATYLLDNAGLHDLDERLNGEGVIESSDAGKIRRIRGVVAAAPWPTEVEPLVTELLAALDGLQEALAADDAEAAAPLATQVHDVGHDLSHDVEAWVSGGEGGSH